MRNQTRSLKLPFLTGRSKSLSSLNLVNLVTTVDIVQEVIGDILTMAMDGSSQSQTKLRLCHQCHAPLTDDVHIGVPSGVGKCQLNHWVGCKDDIPGGKGKNGKQWAACPSMHDSDSDIDDSDDPGETNSEGYDEGPGKKGLLPDSLAKAAASLELDMEKVETTGQLSPLSQLKDTVEEEEDTSSDDEDFLVLQREELERLRQTVEQQSLANKAAEKARQKAERKVLFAQEKRELAHEVQVLKEKQAALLLQSRPSPGAPSSTGTKQKNLKDKVAEHEAKKASKAAAKLLQQQQNTGDGLVMAGIRTIPDVRQEVEQYIAQLKAMAPTLSADPTATGFHPSTFQPDVNARKGKPMTTPRATSHTNPTTGKNQTTKT